MAFSTIPTAGLKLDDIETNSAQLGLEVFDNEGRTRKLVSSGAAITLADCVHISSANIANSITPALAIVAGTVGWARVSCSTSGQLFWAVIDGPVAMRVAAGCQPSIPLYTTDVAGVLDDSTVSLSQYQVMGAYVDAGLSNSAAGVSTLSGVGRVPTIRRPQV